MDSVSRIGVSLDPELLELFDRHISERGYVSRSEAIRDLIRDNLSENEWKDENQVMVGLITAVFDSSVTGITEKLMNTQRTLGGDVLSSTYISLDEKKYMMSLFIRGKLKDLKKISGEIASMKGVLRGKLTMVSPVNGHMHHIG